MIDGLLIDWENKETPETDNYDIWCPECMEWHHVSTWINSETYCEICIEHPAITCPNHYTHDLVLGSPMKWREE